jgi:hypothetical protein
LGPRALYAKTCLKQEAIFGQLTPRALAQLIRIPEVYQPFAPDYLKEPNTKFSKKELQRLGHLYTDYQHLMKNSKGIQNYQMVFGSYKDLFIGLHDYVGLDYKVPFLNHDHTAIHIAWQQQPKKVEEALLEYAASLYYKLQFEALRPTIRVAMSSWFFLQRMERRESDLQDEMVIKEIQRYQACLTQLLSYRKARLAGFSLTTAPAIAATTKSAGNNRNEMPDSTDESST